MPALLEVLEDPEQWARADHPDHRVLEVKQDHQDSLDREVVWDQGDLLDKLDPMDYQVKYHNKYYFLLGVIHMFIDVRI